MGRKVHRVPVYFDTKGISALPFEEIKCILRGADEIIMQGGRSLLAKILKGSKDKKVIELKLHTSAAYGYFKALALDKITAKIDWLILNDYLAIKYDYRLPLLVYTDKGWAIEMDAYSDELLAGFNKLLESGIDDYDMTYLKDRNRQLIFLLLDKVKATNNPKYIPILEAWGKVDYKKVQKKIRYIIRELENK
ncbi:RQC domain protein [bacterium]|nr:RQC domain protein [bacterium]